VRPDPSLRSGLTKVLRWDDSKAKAQKELK